MKRSSRWLPGGVFALVVGAILATAAHGAGPLPGDIRFAHLIQSLGPITGPIGQLMSLVGDAIWAAPLVAVAVALSEGAGRRPWLCWSGV